MIKYTLMKPSVNLTDLSVRVTALKDSVFAFFKNQEGIDSQIIQLYQYVEKLNEQESLYYDAMEWVHNQDSVCFDSEKKWILTSDTKFLKEFLDSQEDVVAIKSGIYSLYLTIDDTTDDIFVLLKGEALEDEK